MAGALGLPAIVGLGSFLDQITAGDIIIVDGTHGDLILDPDPPTLARFRQLQIQERDQAGFWIVHRDLPTETRDGTRIELMGNIEFPAEATHCTQRGAGGIGLYRTEFLYVGKHADPTEEDHFQAYRKVIEEIGPGKPVVIRTLDLGADKFGDLPWLRQPEKNPYLGLRSVRLCPETYRPIQNANARHPAGQCPGGSAHHVPDGQHLEGVTPLQTYFVRSQRRFAG